jgi:hypothetical protein
MLKIATHQFETIKYTLTGYGPYLTRLMARQTKILKLQATQFEYGILIKNLTSWKNLNLQKLSQRILCCKKSSLPLSNPAPTAI